MTQKQNSAMNQAIDLLINNDTDVSTLFKEDGLLKQLTKRLVEKALQSEMNNHLGYSKYNQSDIENARNGYNTKNLITKNGVVEIEVPRDRKSSFEPSLVAKRQRRLDGFDDKVLSLYAKGMSLSDIKLQLQELYGADVSESLISQITDDILEDVKLWQSRPLDPVYAIVFFDCLIVKVRQDKRIINKSVYVALGIDLEGRKDILGLWISENEGAKFWLGNLTEMKNRGMQDILIACSDNLTGMSEAIGAVFPKTEHQLCIVHQIRNSLRYVSYKDRKELAGDLKPIYTASTEKEALASLEAFESKWSKQYPQIAKSWYLHWDNLMIFLGYPEEIRKIIYTTNAVESVNSQLRKVIKNKRVFPNDNAVFKSLYLAMTVSDMLYNLHIARADNSYHKKVKLLLSFDLLILDELGFKQLPKHSVEDFFNIIAKRYENKSTIITTNKDFEKWNEIFADEVLTHAIIDRVVHHAHILNIKGKSYRINNYKSGGNMA